VAHLDVKLAAVAVLLVIPLSVAGVNVYRALHLPKMIPGEWLAALTLSSSALVLAVSGAARGSIGLPLEGSALVWPALQAAASIASYLLFFMLQRRAGPLTTSFVGYVAMITATIVAAVGFGDQLPLAAWPAFGLIAGSVWLLQKSAAIPSLDESAHRASAECLNDHCAVSMDHSMAFDCSAKGLLPCA
jgi:drug/metabolite transporter (DMT)-like permease